MKISVIMSVYNGEKYLKESITSILEQSYNNFEFLIVNDCSTDKTENIIKEFAKNDKRIKYFNNEKQLGLTKNLNKLISLSDSNLIARMDADDIACKDRFLRQVNEFIHNKDVGVVYTNAIIIDKNSNYVCDSWIPENTKYVLKVMPKFNYIIHPSTMIRKDVLYKVGLYDENFKTGQDKNLWLRLVNNNVRFTYLNEKLLKYRINPSSVRSTNNINYNYKLSKTCIANKNIGKAIEYLSDLKVNEKMDILLRCIIPFRLYREILYLKNNLTQKKK